MFSQQFPDFRFPLNPDQKMLLTLPAQFSFPLCAGCVPRGDVPFPLFSRLFLSVCVPPPLWNRWRRELPSFLSAAAGRSYLW